MKYALFAALSMFSLFASANDTPGQTAAAAAKDVQYDYSQDLDIAKVVRISNESSANNACGPVKAQMEYVDSKGVSHKLEYTRLGDECDNG
jgi:phosphoribosylformylglycinamidine (FGAM) synthase PurS component